MCNKQWKKITALALTGVLALSMAACGGKSHKSEKAKEDSTQTKQSNPDYAKGDVVLPEDFGNMIYPVEAVLVQNYSKKLPYYTQDSKDDEGDSFWFSMAVLTSQMNHYVKDVAIATDDRFIYLDEETMNMYASGLYDAFGKGNLEFPDLGEDNPYAVYNEKKEVYGFREGTIGDLEPYITACKEKGKGYVLTVHLKNKDSAEILSSSRITIVPSSYESDDNVFAYSISGFKKLETAAAEDLEDKEDADDNDKKDKKDRSEEDSEQVKSGEIDRDEALELAKEYYGEDAEYTYQETVTIGDYDYYDFKVKGDGISTTDVLVSLDGENVMGGNKNSDGSWSFDQ